MFTGIIETLGTVAAVDHDPAADAALLTVHAGLAHCLTDGASLAVNGVCLTATAAPDSTTAGHTLFRADIMGETLRRTTLGDLAPGDVVNLERSVAVGDRFEGHIVQGHVDATGTVTDVGDQGAWTTLGFTLPAELACQVAEKGAVAVDGTSLTVTAVSPPGHDTAWFEVGIIPITAQHTTLGRLQPGDRVNLETDVVAKQLTRLAGFGHVLA